VWLIGVVSVMKINSCSNTTIQVRSDLCSGDPCQIKRGATGTVLIDFTAHDDSYELTAEVVVKLGTVDVPYPGYDHDACNSHGVECPVKKGNRYTYSLDVHILPEYPKINCVFKWNIKDSNGYDDVCFTMPVTLID